MATIFETETCSRCGGSGHYSYCQSYGTKCFRCHSTKRTLTVRGAAARNWLIEKMKRVASEVEIGTWLLLEGVPGFSRTEMFKVEAITKDPHPTVTNGVVYETITLSGKNKKGETLGISTWPESKVRTVCKTKAELAEVQAEALAYQASLTKAGTVRKRPAKQAA